MPKSGPALRDELDGVWSLEAHPEVVEFFKQVGVYAYYEKLKDFHQQVCESFSISYDGRTATVGKEEFTVDEIAIAKYTGVGSQFIFF
jgi:hypothetical protein